MGILPVRIRGIGILPMIQGLQAHATSKGKGIPNAFSRVGDPKMPSPRAPRPLGALRFAPVRVEYASMRWYRHALIPILFVLAGCATQRVTNPPRTATEQFLLSKAVTDAVEALNFDVLHGRRVHVDERFFGAPEKEVVFGTLRARLLLSGVQIAPDAKGAEIVLEVRSDGVGIDRYDSIVGIPSIGAPPAATSAATGVPTAGIITPEVAIIKETRQISFASIGYVAYWADTGEVVATSGPSVGRAWRSDSWILNFGPRTSGTIPPVEHHLE
jgi:hypothetical protein